MQAISRWLVARELNGCKAITLADRLAKLFLVIFKKISIPNLWRNIRNVHPRSDGGEMKRILLAACLFGNRGRTIARDLLAKIAWGWEREIASSTSDTHIYQICGKLQPNLEREDTSKSLSSALGLARLARVYWIHRIEVF
jgi:hypothetical protein